MANIDMALALAERPPHTRPEGEPTSSIAQRIYIVRHARPLEYAVPDSPLAPDGHEAALKYPAERFGPLFQAYPDRQRAICITYSDRPRTKETAECFFEGFHKLKQELGLDKTHIVEPHPDPTLRTTAPFKKLMDKLGIKRDELKKAWEDLTEEISREYGIPTIKDIGDMMKFKIHRSTFSSTPDLEIIDIWVTHETTHIGLLGPSIDIPPLGTLAAYGDRETGMVICEWNGKRTALALSGEPVLDIQAGN